MGWRVSVLPIPAFHHCGPLCVACTQCSGMQEWVIQIPSNSILVSVLFPSLHLKYFRIKFLLLYKIHRVLASHSCFCSFFTSHPYIQSKYWQNVLVCSAPYACAHKYEQANEKEDRSILAHARDECARRVLIFSDIIYSKHYLESLALFLWRVL